MSFPKKSLLPILVLAAIFGLVSLSLPRSQLIPLYEQTSPGQIDPTVFKESRDTAPLSKNGQILQRLWFPTAKIHSLVVFLHPKNNPQKPPVLSLLADDNGHPGRPLANLSGSLSHKGEHISASYQLEQTNLAGENWYWFRFTQDSSPTAIRFYRDIDSQAYPGGRLIIEDPPRHQEQGVLAFRLDHKVALQPSPAPVILLTLTAIIFLALL
jgi:hypothetical protein